MSPLWMAVAFAAGLLAIIAAMSLVKSGHYRAKQALAKQASLFSSDALVSFDGASALALDKASRKLLLLDQAGARQSVVGFGDILAVELIEEGATITQTSAAGGRGLGRDGVQRLLAGAPTGPGPRGALAPAGEGVGSLALSIVMAQPGDPYRQLYFWNDGRKRLSRRSEQYSRLRGQADRWCAMLQMIIKQADEEEAKPRQGQWEASVVR